MSAKPQSNTPKKKRASRKPIAREPGDRTVEFESLLKDTSKTQRYELRLYVTGTSPRSSQAIANVRSLCEEFLHGRYDLQVIDIFQQPTVAASEQIIAAPTLIRRLPEPLRRLIGDLSDRNKVIIGLNLAGTPDSTSWAKL
jgi:circadian clock protein KaiB